MSPKQKQADTLGSTTESGKPVPERIESAATAYALYQRCMEEDSIAAEKRGRIQGQIDGNPPYPQAELIARGQGHRANVNYREAEAIRDSNAAAYWSLVTEVPTLIDVKITPDKTMREVNDEWGKIIAEEYTDLLFGWEDFYYSIMLHANEMLTFGMGPVGWTDRFDWRFKAFQFANVLIPPATKSTIGGIKLFFVRDSISADELFAMIEDEKIAKKGGWNVSEVRKVIVDRWFKGQLTDGQRYSKSMWENIRQQAKNNDMFSAVDDLDDLKIVHCFVREVKSGKVSHFIFPAVAERKKFMLECRDVYDDMKQVFVPYFYNIGDGFIRSVRGLGARMYQSIELSNRFINTAFDGGMMSASMIVSGGGAANKDLRIMRMGPLTRLPEGVIPLNQAFAPNLNQLIACRTMLQAIMNNNYGTYQSRQENPYTPARTKAEVMIAEQKETRLMNFQIAQYYVHATRMHVETFRRLANPDYPRNHPGWKEREEFFQRCEERGVPHGVITRANRMRIRCVRAIGAGSPALRKESLQSLLRGSAFFDAVGKFNVVRDWAAAEVGYDGADRYTPMRNRDKIPTNEHGIANLENNDMVEGASVLVGTDQLHQIHMVMHVPPLTEVVQGIEQALQQNRQVNPEKVLPYLSVAIEHAGGHVRFMSADPRYKEEVKQYVAMLQKADAVRTALAKVQQRNDAQKTAQSQQMQQVLAEAQQATQSEGLKVRLAQVQANLQVDMAEAQGKLQIRAATAQGNLRIKELLAAAEVQLQARESGVPVESGVVQ